MNKGIGKTVKQFLLWCFLYVATLIIGVIWRTGSIILGIIIHVGNNSLSFIDLSGQSNTILLIILIGSLLLLGYGLWWFGKKCNFADEIDKNT